jgi:hypothetical protein
MLRAESDRTTKSTTVDLPSRPGLREVRVTSHFVLTQTHPGPPGTTTFGSSTMRRSSRNAPEQRDLDSR